MRLLLILAALASPFALAACGDDVAELRNQAQDVQREAEQTLDDIKSGATADQVREELDKVKRELDKSDVPEDVRRELEQARDELEQAAKDIGN